MFRCGICGRQTPKGEPATRRVMETREVSYKARAKANRDGSDDRGGHGREIVRETLACLGCSMSLLGQLDKAMRL